MRRPEATRIEELVDGEVIMPPAASFRHQGAAGRLYVALASHAESSGDVALVAPFDVGARG